MITQDQSKFDAAASLLVIRQVRGIVRRRRTWRKSKLDPHRDKLVALRRVGGSYASIAYWLRTQNRKFHCIARSTIMRYLRELPEMQATEDTDAKP